MWRDFSVRQTFFVRALAWILYRPFSLRFPLCKQALEDLVWEVSSSKESLTFSVRTLYLSSSSWIFFKSGLYDTEQKSGMQTRAYILRNPLRARKKSVVFYTTHCWRIFSSFIHPGPFSPPPTWKREDYSSGDPHEGLLRPLNPLA